MIYTSTESQALEGAKVFLSVCQYLKRTQGETPFHFIRVVNTLLKLANNNSAYKQEVLNIQTILKKIS